MTHTPTPILVGHLMAGVIFVEDGVDVGIASDNALCAFGVDDRPERVERYLTDYPNREDW